MIIELKNRMENEQANQFSPRSHIDIDFKILDDFVYHIANGKNRLCIFEVQKQKVFRMIYDDNHHADSYRCYQKISDTLYIFRLSRKLRTYIDHCFFCQINQIKRHQSYEKLISVFIASYSFHIIIMNFIIDLLEKYDCFLIIIDKLIRRLQLIADYIIDFAAI